MNFFPIFVPVIKKSDVLFHNKLMGGTVKQFVKERKGNIHH